MTTKTTSPSDKKRGDRIRKARIDAGFDTTRAAAEALGTPEQTVYKWERGERRPSDDEIVRIAKRLRSRPEWLTFGIQYDAERPAGRVPELDARAGAGGGGLAIIKEGNGIAFASEEMREAWHIPDGFIRGELRMDASKALIIEVSGDSGYDPSNPHAPGSLFPGDRVIVDLRDTNPSPPGPFLVYDGFGLVVKLCDPVRGSDLPRLRLSSRNPSYPPYEISADPHDGEGRIIGRIRGRITTM